MNVKLAGCRVVVTGAASGIGAATVERLKADGADVFGVDLTDAADFSIDVSADGASEQIVAAALDRLGTLDGLVACAGVTRFELIETHDDAVWDRIMAINVTAIFRLIRAAVPALKASGRGRIVTLGSVMSSFGGAGLSAYAASKHAVLGLSRSLASELGAHGITVNCVQPGAIVTPMTVGFLNDPAFAASVRPAAIGRLGQPGDVADVIAFLLSADARFMSGHGIFVDGGAMQTV